MIKLNDTSNLKNRVGHNYGNELKIYRARIYDNCGEKDNRLQVRIVPYMNDIPDDECDNLPKYPCFFRGQVVRGYTEKDPNPKTKLADIVMVAAIPDFTYGFVLGLGSTFEGLSDEKMLSYWDYQSVKGVMNRFALGAQKNTGDGMVDYNDIYVDVINSNASYIEFHSISTGAKWIMDGFGDCIHLGPHKVCLVASSGSEMKSKAYSRITMTPSKISFEADVANFSGCDKIILSNHAHNLVGTLANGPVSCDGMELMPVDNILV